MPRHLRRSGRSVDPSVVPRTAPKGDDSAGVARPWPVGGSAWRYTRRAVSETRSNVRSGPGTEPQPDLLPALVRQWFVIALAAVIGMLAAMVYSSSQPVVYEARSTLLLIAAGDEYAPGGGRERTLDVDTWATVARSTELLSEVANELELSLPDVRRRSTATASPTGDVLILTFEAGDEANAVIGADVYSSKFLQARQTTVNAVNVEARRQLEQLAADIVGQIDGFAEAIDAEERLGEAASDSRLTVLINAQQRATERLSDVESEIAQIDIDEVTGRVLIDPSTAVDRAGLGRSLIVLSGLLFGLLLGIVIALLRDRYDDRYGSAVAPEQAGIRELARVAYADPLQRTTRVDLRAYERLATKLALAPGAETSVGRSVLLLPVESRTVPPYASVGVASALEASGSTGTVSVGVWSYGGDEERSGAHWDAARRALDQLVSSVDLAVVPAEPMDVSSAGLSLCGLVDRVVLLISDNTPVALIEEALDDVNSVAASGGDIIVLTSVRRRYR